MKKYLFLICSVIVLSCKKVEKVKEAKIVQAVTEKKTETEIEKAENYKRPTQSKIINPKFDLKLLFGIWTYDPEGPHADFELTKKSFYVVDYDGNGDMPYIINQDTIKVYYSDYESVGIIKSVTKDTLKIDWDKNGIVNCVKWKESLQPITATTTDLGIGLNGKLVVYLEYLANPKIGLNLIPNPL